MSVLRTHKMSEPGRHEQNAIGEVDSEAPITESETAARQSSETGFHESAVTHQEVAVCRRSSGSFTTDEETLMDPTDPGNGGPTSASLPGVLGFDSLQHRRAVQENEESDSSDEESYDCPETHVLFARSLNERQGCAVESNTLPLSRVHRPLHEETFAGQRENNPANGSVNCQLLDRSGRLHRAASIPNGQTDAVPDWWKTL